MEYSAVAAWQAGHASCAAMRRIRLTREFSINWRRATAVVAATSRFEPQPGHTAVGSGDPLPHTEQVRIGAAPPSSGPDCNGPRDPVNPPPMARTILHVDLDSFFCSVEEILQPSLRGQAFVVAGRPEHRGVVASASYPARRHGIHSAMPTARALRLLPDLRVVPPRHGTYGDFSRKVMALLRESAPRVEPISVDEAFLDSSDDPRGGEAVASALQSEIRHRFQLPSSWGVASN